MGQENIREYDPIRTLSVLSPSLYTGHRQGLAEPGVCGQRTPVILLRFLPLLLPGARVAVPVWVLGTGTLVKCSHPLSDLPGPLVSFLTFFFCPVSPVSS